MNDGDAIFFDGRLWHGSWNTRVDGTRVALLQTTGQLRVVFSEFDRQQQQWQRQHIPSD